MKYIHKKIEEKNAIKFAEIINKQDINEYKKILPKIYRNLCPIYYFPYIFCAVTGEREINCFFSNNDSQLQYLINYIYECEMKRSGVVNSHPETIYLKHLPLVILYNKLSKEKSSLLLDYIYDNGNDFELMVCAVSIGLNKTEKFRFTKKIIERKNPYCNCLLSLFDGDLEISKTMQNIFSATDSHFEQKMSRLISTYYGLNELFYAEYKKYGIEIKRLTNASDKDLSRKEIFCLGEEYIRQKEKYDKYLKGLEKHF